MFAKITIIGSGNVGYHLAQRLKACGHEICQVYSRTQTKSTALAKLTKSESINDLKLLSIEADIYIIAVKDDAVKTLAEEIYFLNDYNKIIAHTSGSLPSTVFEGLFKDFGVFYPLQTFSIQKEANFEKLPFCIYGNTAATEERLEALAKTICPNVYLVNDEQRSILHLTAVVVNNFSNYLYGIAHEICQDKNVSFDILKPLIQETVQKIKQSPPKDVQTGPATRGDSDTIDQHLKILEEYPNYQPIYKLLTKGILDWKKEE
jgi:predicted short-subunit dehydrogenase-like oxidoreductase (DUF2520 family)